MKTGQKKNNYRYRRQRTRAAQPHLQCAASPDLLKKIVNSWCRETLQLVLAGLSAYTRRRTIRTVGTVHPSGLRQHSSIPPHTVREHVSAETGYLPVPANHSTSGLAVQLFFYHTLTCKPHKKPAKIIHQNSSARPNTFLPDHPTLRTGSTMPAASWENTEHTEIINIM